MQSMSPDILTLSSLSLLIDMFFGMSVQTLYMVIWDNLQIFSDVWEKINGTLGETKYQESTETFVVVRRPTENIIESDIKQSNRKIVPLISLDRY